METDASLGFIFLKSLTSLLTFAMNFSMNCHLVSVWFIFILFFNPFPFQTH
jgi:hypothetical protein